MLYKIASNFSEEMIFKDEGPLISLYQPTHRYSPDNKQDPILYKNLLRDIENSLKVEYEPDVIESIMKPFYQLQKDKNFWNNTLDGIAILASTEHCTVYNLYDPVKALVVVANSFHIKPLLQAFQSIENYQLLGLDRENFSLYQGNRFSVQNIKMDEDTPRTIKDFLGDKISEPYLTHGTYAGPGNSTMYHGHGSSKEESDKDTERFFRYVDDFVFENYSKESKLPLILVSLKEYHSQFEKLSKNTYLLEEGIEKSFKNLRLDEIEKMARVIIDKINMEKTKKLADSYGKAESQELGSSDLSQVAKAAYEGRVGTILIEADKVMPGRIDYNNGNITFGDLDKPDYDDIIDDLAELVLFNGGEVLILPKEQMPTSSGIAAIYRHS